MIVANKLDMLQLEKETVLVETDTLNEEKQNARNNYGTLDKEMSDLEKQLPYPETHVFTTGYDYDDIDKIKYEKSQNRPYWEKMNLLRPYCENGSLYCGHLNYGGSSDFYFIDGNPDVLTTKLIGDTVRLINVDDRTWAKHIYAWRYPDRNPDVSFSRNIVMHNRNVTDVDIVMDKGNELYAKITDAYLRKALVRNKKLNGAQSIIQTIQRKQDEIRSLSVNKSFIVQGCAGSGKTMVLLHRIRYLIYNKDINSGEYVFLVPGFHFKEFINEISAQFKIDRKSILPYQSYYRQLIEGDKANTLAEDVNELVFSPKYLSKVYSKEFMQENYRVLFADLSKQIENLIAFCEEKLNKIIDNETTLAKNSLKISAENAVAMALNVTKHLTSYIPVTIVDIPSAKEFSTRLREAFEKAKAEYGAIVSSNNEISVNPDDERIIKHPQIVRMQANIDAERALYSKASIFTKGVHRSKLKKLEDDYSELFSAVEAEIKAQEKARLSSLADIKSNVFDGVSIEDVSAVLTSLDELLQTTERKITNAEYRKNNIDAYISEKYKDLISELNEMIELSSNVIERGEDFVKSLSPSIDFVEEITNAGNRLFRNFTRAAPPDNKSKASDNFKLFADRSSQQRQAYMNTLLLNACKRSIKSQFDITICNAYKHYWYIVLSCQYLTRTPRWNSTKTVFIDECQDLSVSEIELIYKINNAPVLNLFGDKNQSITEHGISDWRSIDMISKIYELDEDFRNTNQIVDYCNKVLPFNMKKVGVDMEPVSTYSSLTQARVSSHSINSGAIFIVKNEFAKEDLLIELKNTFLSDYSIFTVKEAKGLEFSETFVVERDMSVNEKYIAYTRALVKMNIITSLPYHTDQTKALFIQGNAEDELTETADSGEK